MVGPMAAGSGVAKLNSVLRPAPTPVPFSEKFWYLLKTPGASGESKAAPDTRDERNGTPPGETTMSSRRLPCEGS